MPPRCEVDVTSTSTCSSSERGSRVSTSSTGRSRRAYTARLLEAGGGVGGTWYWNRYPGRTLRLGELHLRLPLLEGPLRRLALGGALRPPARDGALPQPRGGPLRPAAAHPLRRRGQLGRVRGVQGTWSVVATGGIDLRARFVVAATGVLSVPYAPDVPGRDDFAGDSYHTGRWPAEPVDFRGKRVAVIGTSSSGVQVVPSIADQVDSLTVYQRTANWCTPLNNRPITPEEQAHLRADFEQLRETLNTSVHGFHHAAHDRTAFEDPEEQRQAVLREDVEQPGLHQADQQLPGPAVEPRGQCRVVRLHCRKDPRHRRRPGDRRAPRPAGPPVR